MDAREWLDSHVNLETGVGVPASSTRATAPSRERIEALLRYLGSPELEFPAVHITGTNGKTSTARMITQLLGSVGLSVGSYTSPHLERVNERIAYQGEPISDADLDELLRTVAIVEGELDIHPSFFDVLTAAAYRWFADLAVDAAVVEVGLGGTWDATNSLDTRVAVITNVALDHVEYLGPTRAQVAAEKAGIVTPGSTLVLGETDPELEHFFTDRGAAEVLRRDVDFGVRDNVLAVGGRLVELYTPMASYADVLVPLHGAHQADNAAIALAAAEAFLGAPLDPEVVAGAFALVRSPGRLELVRQAAARDPRRRAQRRRRRGAPGRARRGVRERAPDAVGRDHAREGTARDAHCAGHRRGGASRLLPAAERARARSERARRRRDRARVPRGADRDRGVRE